MIGKFKLRKLKTTFIANNCPNIAMYLRVTRVFLSNCKFSSSLKRVEKFIVKAKYRG